MLFRKGIEPCCAYCGRGLPLSEDEVICRRHGVVSASDHCNRFSYDPLRRTPPVPAPLRTEALQAEDFSLEEE